MASSALTFVVVGHDDHPIYEIDLAARGDSAVRDDRAQYLHQFVLHAALDAVEEQQWRSTSMHLSVVDRFNKLQASHGLLHLDLIWPISSWSPHTPPSILSVALCRLSLLWNFSFDKTLPCAGLKVNLNSY